MSPHTDAGALLKPLADDVVREMHSVLPTQWDRDCLHAKVTSALLQAAFLGRQAASHGSAGGERAEVRSVDTIPLADHDEIGRKVIGQPWAIQAAIVTICAHCTVLVDKHPTGDVADLAGCISDQCRELANALSGGVAQASGEPDDWKALAWDKVSEAHETRRAKTIEECARYLETSYPDHAWLNAACAAIRSLSVPSATRATPACDCGFAADVCETNHCYRKQIASAGLSPVPTGYSKLPDGVVCKCFKMWRATDGSHWCCLPSAEGK